MDSISVQSKSTTPESPFWLPFRELISRKSVQSAFMFYSEITVDDWLGERAILRMFFFFENSEILAPIKCPLFEDNSLCAIDQARDHPQLLLETSENK